MRTADNRITAIERITYLMEQGGYADDCYQCGEPYTLNAEGDLHCVSCGNVHDIGDYVDSKHEERFDC
ncbi:MAG: hypothetical protein AB1454_04100 [Candidatus Auribacterota bacterium]